MTTPLLGLSEISEGVVNQATIHNTALRQLEALLVRALSMSTLAPPASPVSGDSYIIPPDATGVWAGKANQVAAYIGGGWTYFAAKEGIRLWVNDSDVEVVFDGAAWVANGGGTGDYLTQAEGDARYRQVNGTEKAYIQLACSDEATALTAGNSKITFRMPYPMTLAAVRASLSTASTSGLVTVNVKEGGVSIFSTQLTVDANDKTSLAAATPAVISDASLADDAEITVDIVTAGTGAKGLKLTLIGTRPA